MPDGKHTHIALPQVVNQTIRSAFEYSGQKCSACSRAYFPKSLWPQIKEGLLEAHKKIKVGQSDDFSVFMTSVIDEKSFDNITQHIDEAHSAADANVLAGGTYDKSQGFFIQPTIIEVADPKYTTMEEELFGPVLTVFVYEDSQYEETLRLCDETSPYALTGSIFARDRSAILTADAILKNACGIGSFFLLLLFFFSFLFFLLAHPSFPLYLECFSVFFFFAFTLVICFLFLFCFLGSIFLYSASVSVLALLSHQSSAPLSSSPLSLVPLPSLVDILIHHGDNLLPAGMTCALHYLTHPSS